MKMKITFDKSTRRFILATFGKTVDKDEYVVEKDKPTQKVLTADGQEIKVKEFAGIRRGSEVFIKSDLTSLIKFADGLANFNGLSN
jgi:hypothetical protein